MANFLPKERIEVQSVGAFGADNLAKDISGLMTATQGLAKTINKSMVSESEDIGKALARDALIEWKRTETAFNEARNLMGQQFYESVDNQPSAYEQTSQDLKMFMPQKLADVKEKLGSDSVAYKAFEDHFLLQGTNLTENYKSELSKEHEHYAKIQLNQSAIKQIDELGNDIGDKNLIALRNSTKYSMTDEQFSKEVAIKLLGHMENSGFDAKQYNGGKPLTQEQKQKIWNRFADSVSVMDKNGSVKSKGILTSEDLSSMKNRFDVMVKVTEKTATYNPYYAQGMDALSTLISDVEQGRITLEQANTNGKNVKEIISKAYELGKTDPNIGEVTPSQDGAFAIKAQELSKQVTMLSFVEEDIKTQKEDDIRTYLDKGRDVKINGYDVLIPASRYQAVLDRNIQYHSNIIYKADVSSPEGLKEFNSSMFQIERIESINKGTKSAVTKDMEDKLDSKDTGAIRSVADARRLVAYGKYKQSRGNEYWDKSSKLLDRIEEQLMQDKDKPKEVQLSNINNLVTTAKTQDRIKTSSGEMTKAVNTFVSSIESGSFGWFDFKETTSAIGTTAVIKDMLNVAREQDIPYAIENLDGKISTMDYGGMNPFGRADRRVIFNSSFNRDAVSNAIDDLLSSYNKIHKSNLSRKNTEPSVSYNKSNGNIDISIYSGQEHIGTITKEAIERFNIMKELSSE